MENGRKARLVMTCLVVGLFAWFVLSIIFGAVD